MVQASPPDGLNDHVVDQELVDQQPDEEAARRRQRRQDQGGQGVAQAATHLGQIFLKFQQNIFNISNVTGMQYELVCVPEPASVSVAAVSSLLRELEEAEPEGPFRTTTGK